MDTATTMQVADVVDSARERAQEQATHTVDKGAGALRTQVNTRSTQAGEHAQSIAETLRHTATQLRQTGDEQKVRYAGIADQNAARLERVGGYLTESPGAALKGRGAGAPAAVARCRHRARPGHRHRPVLEGFEYGPVLPPAANACGPTGSVGILAQPDRARGCRVAGAHTRALEETSDGIAYGRQAKRFDR